MSEQEEGRLRSAATTAVVVVDQRASQAEPEIRNKQEQYEPGDVHQKWSKLSDIPLSKEAQAAASCPRSLHVPDLKTFETIELTEMGSGSATVDTENQYVETTFAMKMDSEPIVQRAVKHFETTFPAKMDSEPIMKRNEGTISSKMEMDHSVPLVGNRLEPPAAIFKNAVESESSLKSKQLKPVAFECKPTITKVTRSSEKASDPIPLEVKSTMTTLTLEHTCESTMTNLSRLDTFEPISAGVKSTTTKVLYPVERASDPIPLEMKATMTTLTLQQISDPVPLEAKTTMTTLHLDKTFDPIARVLKSAETKVLLNSEKTESIPLNPMGRDLEQLEKTTEVESDKDSILEDNAVQLTRQEGGVTDWEETNGSQKREISWNDCEYLDKVQLQTLSEAKLVPLQDATATCSRDDLLRAKPCGITLSLIPQKSLTYFNNYTAKTGVRIVISKGCLAGSRSQFAISEIDENLESENFPAMESSGQFSAMPHCLGVLRAKIDMACNKIIQYFTK